jgi:hypothetical protein
LRYSGQVVASLDARSNFIGARLKTNPECLLSIVRALSPCSLEIPLCHSIPRPALLLFCCFRHGSRAALDMRDGSYTHHLFLLGPCLLSAHNDSASPVQLIMYTNGSKHIENAAGVWETWGGGCKNWGWRLHDLRGVANQVNAITL